jgi:hypothetical protein
MEAGVGRVKLDLTFKSIEGGKTTRKETEPDANADEFDPTLVFVYWFVSSN